MDHIFSQTWILFGPGQTREDIYLSIVWATSPPLRVTPREAGFAGGGGGWMSDLMDGKASTVKYVFKIEETPGL